MADARRLVQDIRLQIRGVEAEITGHPYLAAVEEGRPAREKLRIFAGEQYYIIGSDLRSLALLVVRHGGLPSRDFFLGALQGEAAARQALLAFAEALGMAEEDLRAYEPLAGAQAYPAYVAWLALYGSDAEVAAAFLVNLPAWGSNCGRLSQALRQRYGLAEAAVAFFDLFATTPPDFEENALVIIQKGLERGVDPAAIARACRLVQAYELMYWDTVHQASLP